MEKPSSEMLKLGKRRRQAEMGSSKKGAEHIPSICKTGSIFLGFVSIN